ncbi:hypothetical protein GGR62_000861 [Xanthomonas campestris]|nr:hypothetical protein [Xanthomonas sp. 3075]
MPDGHGRRAAGWAGRGGAVQQRRLGVRPAERVRSLDSPPQPHGGCLSRSQRQRVEPDTAAPCRNTLAGVIA